jgi:hypothetical protein
MCGVAWWRTTSFSSKSYCKKPNMPPTTPNNTWHSSMANGHILVEHLSCFRQALPEQIDWIRLSPAMASGVMRPHVTGLCLTGVHKGLCTNREFEILRHHNNAQLQIWQRHTQCLKPREGGDSIMLISSVRKECTTFILKDQWRQYVNFPVNQRTNLGDLNPQHCCGNVPFLTACQSHTWWVMTGACVVW